MRESKSVLRSFYSVAASACVSLGLTVAGAVEANANDSEPYEWSADLVSFDDATNTAVFRENVTTFANIEAIDRFNDGDRAILVWGGRLWASGIRSFGQDPELTPDTLSLPVEFVSADSNGNYIDFRVSIPESATEVLSEIEPGMRVTGTTPRMATDWQNSIISLRHYNDVD